MVRKRPESQLVVRGVFVVLRKHTTVYLRFCKLMHSLIFNLGPSSGLRDALPKC